ncbi:MAG: RNA 2',3'-cyclic phosphodiesterase [Treponema sp.]|jgi:2'-5' RNA ligase|nr:RNA 2',3'-cyclic phosphodiesterase [Treponema sp.]
MRIFVALKLPPELAAAVNEQAEPLRKKYPDFRWIREENLHITLAFLGELDDPPLAILNEAVSLAVQKTHPVSLRTGKLFAIPRGRPANVLALGIEQGKDLIAALAADVEKILAEQGKQKHNLLRPPETRIFVPHITLARRGSIPLKISPEERNNPILAQGTVNTLGVFKSDLGRNGPVYTLLAAYPLPVSGEYPR